MKVKFLGSAASEGCPAVFCDCECCHKARELGGKNIRTRHQTLINDDMVVDLPADTYYHVLCHGLRLDKVKHLLITHAHEDHFNPLELRNKTIPYAHNQQEEVLNVYGGDGANKLHQKVNGNYNINNYQEIVKFNFVENYTPISIGDGYTITSLPARHDFGNDARIYIIQKDNKSILYAHDTGILYDEVYDYIEKNKLTFDFITLDCTNVTLEWPDHGSHMGFCQIERLIKRLKDMGAINSKTIKYVNHFSHNGNALHEYIEEVAKKYDIRVAFDGEEVEF